MNSKLKNIAIECVQRTLLAENSYSDSQTKTRKFWSASTNSRSISTDAIDDATEDLPEHAQLALEDVLRGDLNVDKIWNTSWEITERILKALSLSKFGQWISDYGGCKYLNEPFAFLEPRKRRTGLIWLGTKRNVCGTKAHTEHRERLSTCS